MIFWKGLVRLTSCIFGGRALYSENEEFVWGLAERKVKGKSLWQVKNAKKFLDKAWEIRLSDPAMAKFRALNAVEEASCALVEVLKTRRYENAKRINLRVHEHKMALWLDCSLEMMHYPVAFIFPWTENMT